MRHLFLIATIISSLPHITGAECIDSRTTSQVDSRTTSRAAVESSDLIFKGTVTKVEDPNAPGLTQVLTFDVDEVWKGPAVKQQIIYHLVSVESRIFRTGDKLVVFARQVAAADRERVGLPRDGTPVFAYRSFDCGGNVGSNDVYSDLARLPSIQPQ